MSSSAEAGRLRAKLREYYGTEGAGDTIRFDLPNGRYNPDILVDDIDEQRHNDGLLKQTIRFCQTDDNVAIA